MLALSTASWSANALAARPVEWATIDVRDGADAKRVEKSLRMLLKKATRAAKWGKGGTLVLSARVTHFEWEQHDDVLRLTVTVVARIRSGASARSHIRVGGRLTERSKLEKQALGIVAGGLVTRLADMARGR